MDNGTNGTTENGVGGYDDNSSAVPIPEKTAAFFLHNKNEREFLTCTMK